MKYKYKKIQGVKIAYRDEGKGLPLFMIPPWTSGSFVYERLTELLDKDEYRIIRIDLPGWGGAGAKDILEDKSFDSYLKIITEFINSFEFDEYTTLGYSIGVAIIVQGIERGLINPNKVVVVSGFIEHDDIFTAKRLAKNLKYYPIVKDRRVLRYIMRYIMKFIYIKEGYQHEIYKREGRRETFFQIINENVSCDIESVMEPVFSLGTVDPLKLKRYNGKLAVVYNINEPDYYQKSNRKIADIFGVKPHIVEAFDHRHLSIEPEKSVGYIDNFLRN